MIELRRTAIAAMLSMALGLGAGTAAAQEVELVVVDPKAATKGYSARQLMGENVMNERRETIGSIDDVIVAHSSDDSDVYVVLEVGSFLGLGGHLVAVPFTSIEVDERNDRIVLAGATREALQKLPVYHGAS